MIPKYNHFSFIYNLLSIVAVTTDKALTLVNNRIIPFLQVITLLYLTIACRY